MKSRSNVISLGMLGLLVLKMMWFNGGSRMISRARWSQRLSLAGIACLSLALVGWGGLTCAQAQEQASTDAQNARYTIQDLRWSGRILTSLDSRS